MFSLNDSSNLEDFINSISSIAFADTLREGLKYRLLSF